MNRWSKIKEFCKEHEEEIYVLSATAAITGMGCGIIYKIGIQTGQLQMTPHNASVMTTESGRKAIAIESNAGFYKMLWFKDQK